MSAGPAVLKDNVWQERVLVAFTNSNDTTIQFASTFNEIGFDGGAKEVEGTPLMNGGRVRNYSAQEDYEVSGTLYPIGVQSASNNNSLAEFIHGSLLSSAPSLSSVSQDPSSNSGVEMAETTLERADLRLAVMWTNDSGVTDATASVGPDSSVNALRLVWEDVHVTEVIPSFDDQVLTEEFTAVVPPFDASGNSRFLRQEYTGDASDSLAALDAYNGS